VPLKDNSGNSVVEALTILFQDRKPNTIQSDKGTEFVNTTVQQYLERKGVDFHTSHVLDIKGAAIERFNRTLKTRMYKYFTKFSTYRYVETKSNLLAGYNRAVHSTIGMPPGSSPSNIYSVWQK
jgi:transposase InsO family protein